MPSKGWGGNIEQAIEALNQALEVCTREAMPAEWAEITVGLGVAYYERIQGDKAENLEQAIKLIHEALQVLTRQRMPLLWSTAMMELGLIYSGRIRGDRVENIERAIEIYHQALEVENVEIRPTMMMNLATAYQKRLRGDRAENIERAIQLYEQALEVCTRETTPVEWARTKLELGHAYFSRLKGDKAENVECSINAYEEALEVRTREAWPAEWAGTMQSLASAYVIRVGGDRMENIERSIEMYEQALKVWIGKGRHHDAVKTMGLLANAYLMRTAGSRPENFDRAVDIYQQTLDDLTPEAQPVFCLATAYLLGNLHFGETQWEEAHIAYGKAITAGEMLYQAAATEITRQIELSQALYLFSNDAYCLARLDRFTEAVERLEAGKARALAEALARDRAALEQAATADRKAFETARNRIKGLEVEFRAMEAAGPENATARSFTEISEDLRSARQGLAEVVKCIRTYVPDFMPAGLDFEAIAATAASACPLVYVVATSQGSLALIVPRGVKSLKKKHAVWLNDFDSNDLNELLSQKDADGNVIGGYLLGQVGGNMRLLQVALEQALPILGKQLMSPVTARLVGLGFQQATLIPSGRLGLLPLHAGRYPADGGSRSFLDDFEVTYAPSARALAASHRAVEAAGARAPSFFAVADPPHTGAQRLAFARVEVEDIVPLFTESASCPLYAEQATRAEALKASPGRTHIHFSCHGSFDTMEPLNSALLLAGDDRLTLQDILDEADLKGSRLATLSACQTAIIDFLNVPDEAVGLPAGFLQAGVPGVVGSLWSVNDVSTALLIVRFYQYHLGKDESGESIEPLPPAAALRSAQLWLRDATREELGNSCLALVRMSPGEAHRELVLAGNPSEKPYANPYFWAAFTFTGA
jgi:CHAT domain-containing protein/tetratricopeptide (TPR) repeat protein